MKRLLSVLVFVFLFFGACVLHADEAAKKPNVIFILADDLGWMDLGCQGSRYYETPNIDRLASEGFRLRNYHNCQNCQPTRAALMSGQYGARTGVYTVGGIGRFEWETRPLRPVENNKELPLDRVTIAQSLKAAGYATAMFGKWHLGEKGKFHPGARGFDEAIVSMGHHFNFETDPKEPLKKGEYLADFLTEKAVDFIQRNASKPFFLYLPHFGVHAPHEAKPEWIEKFNEKPAVEGHSSPVYAAMIASVDESVGRILKRLDELKLVDNTIVIFSSDNGGVGGYEKPGGVIYTGKEAVEPARKGSHSITDNTPLRSGKGSLYEGGIRVPFIVRWPGVTRPGSFSDVPSIHVDMYPTLLEMTNSQPPKDYVLDGESLVSVIRDPDKSLRREAIFQHFPGYLGFGTDLWRTTPVGVIQAGDWKLMEYFEDQRLELYNLKDDLGEKVNLAMEQPQKVAELKAKMKAWREAVSAPMPTANAEQKEAESRKNRGKGKRGGEL